MPNSGKPVEIQLALQGGGAKIVALLAVADALKEMQDERTLKVTRIAGTSAGSIVACLFAAGVHFSEVRTVLQTISTTDPKRLTDLFPAVSRTEMAWRLWKGQPFWSAKSLISLLELVFDHYKVYKLEDLYKKTTIRVLIVATNLVDGQRVVYQGPEDKIVSSVVSSCAIPFFFRNAANAGDNATVDGGVCENLPVDELEQEEAVYGPTVGVSFQEWQAGRPPQDSLEFSIALLDTSINHSVQRAKAKLGAGRVHNIETKIGTFEFERALLEGLGASYDNIKTAARTWFTGLAASLKDRDPLRSLTGDPWATADPQLLSKMWDVYKAQHFGQRHPYIRCSLVVRAHSLLTKDESKYGSPDEVEYTLVFHPPADTPLYCTSLALSPLKAANGVALPLTYFGKTWWRVTHPSHAVNAIGFPALDKGSPENREYLLFFVPPLNPVNVTTSQVQAKPYTLVYQDLVEKAMPNLVDGKADEIGYAPRRTDVPVGSIELVLHIPDRLTSMAMSPKSGPIGRPMTEQELVAAEFRPRPGFRAIGWTASDVPPGAEFVVHVIP